MCNLRDNAFARIKNDYQSKSLDLSLSRDKTDMDPAIASPLQRKIKKYILKICSQTKKEKQKQENKKEEEIQEKAQKGVQETRQKRDIM